MSRHVIVSYVRGPSVTRNFGFETSLEWTCYLTFELVIGLRLEGRFSSN